MYPNQQNNNNKLSKVFSGKASIEDTYLIDIYISKYILLLSVKITTPILEDEEDINK